MTAPATVYTYMVGMKYPMPGVAGGSPGRPNRFTFRVGTEHEQVVTHTLPQSPIGAGEAYEYVYGGGGGWGDPLERDPESVREDVLDEYVSINGARCDYGVVLTGSVEDWDLVVDRIATDRLRSQMRDASGSA